MKKILLLLFILSFSMVFNLYAQTEPVKQVIQGTSEEEGEKFYKGRSQRGWWWYEDPEKKVEPQKLKKQEKITEVPETKKQDFKKKIKPLKDYKYEELLYMPVDEFKEIYNYYLELAVGNPSEENIYNFYNIQDVMRKKALLFTTRSMYVWQKYPELSTARDVPVAYPGLVAKKEEMKREISSVLASKKGDYGLILFISPTCPYCKTQAEIVKMIQNYYGWDIKIVDITKDKQAPAVFAIEVVPTLILVHRESGNWLPVGTGVVPLMDLETNILLAVRNIEGASEAKWGLYQFQENTSLDPLEPSPLWKKGSQKPGKGGIK
ncbi:MAG: conjugal transfer protein TraF [Candidatus Micrarchaeia archaeon]